MSRILIVDDEPDIRLMLKLALELGGHEVTEASDGREALEKVYENPDAVVLDIRLPDIDGLEVLRLVKSDPTVAAIPVVCISAHSSGDTVRRALALGASAYVGKPFDFNDVRSVVGAAIDASPTTRAS